MLCRGPAAGGGPGRGEVVGRAARPRHSPPVREAGRGSQGPQSK